MAAAAEKVAEKVKETLIEIIKREVGYLIDYDKNMNNLEKERGDIQSSIQRIQDEVNEAKNHGRIVYPDVEQWLTEAYAKKAKVDGLLQEGTSRDAIRCLGDWCSYLGSRYKHSKKAVSMINDLDEFKKWRDFEIPKRISYPAPPPEFGVMSSPDDFQAFTSRAIVFKKVMAALIDDRVNMVGICGLEGVGKTTMAEEIGKHLKVNGHFDEVVMVAVSQNVNLRKIQGELAEGLGLTLEIETEETGRAGKLWNRLNNGKKNLVILDDLWSKLEIKKIGIPIAGGNKGCKVLLTSRNQRVFKDMNVEKDFSLRVLNDEEALLLFHNKMGNSASEIRESIVEEVCKECGGLPVVILTVAASLKGKSNEIWNMALAELRDSKAKYIAGVDPKGYASLKLSYDLLRPEDAKECLLICCLFPEDADISIEDLVRYGMGMGVLEYVFTLEDARDRVHMLVETLKTSSLLIDGRNENSFKMHDVIRDMAITIATNKKAFLVRHGAHFEEWPDKDACEGCTVISLRSKNTHELPDGWKCPRLHTLVLECKKAKIPVTFFSGMTQLRLLHMKGINLRTLPSSLESLSSLRMLCLEGCWLGDTSLVVKDLKNMEILSLYGSDIKELSPELKQLTNLRLLDLRKCKDLHVIPPNIISSLTGLERLLISNTFDKWEVESTNRRRINASLAELNLLACLVALEIRIPDASLLPDNLCIFGKLIRYKVSIGDPFIDYDDSYQSTNKSLRLSDFHVRDDIEVLLEKAEYLYLTNLTGLVNVFHKQDTPALSDLKYLHVESCDDLKYLLGEGAWLSKLRELRIEGCGLLKSLFPPSTARSLKQLKVLYVSNCEEMEEIIGSDSDSDKYTIVFDQLKHLTLDGLKNFKSFYPNANRTQNKEATTSSLAQSLLNEKVAFPALEELELKSLSNSDIWDKSVKGANSFGNLKRVTVELCDKLVNVIPSHITSKLCQLHILTVTSCESVVCIVEGIDNVDEGKECKFAETINLLPELTELKLEDLKSLICLFGRETAEYYSGRVVPAIPNRLKLSIKRCPALRNEYARWQATGSSQLWNSDEDEDDLE